MIHLVAPNPKESHCLSAKIMFQNSDFYNRNKHRLFISLLANSQCFYWNYIFISTFPIWQDELSSVLQTFLFPVICVHVLHETYCLPLRATINKHPMQLCVPAFTDSGSPSPKEESPSAQQTVCPQGATRRYGSAGQFSPPEDGAVCCALHRNQSLRGLRQVRQRRFRLALLWQHGWPWRWVSWPFDAVSYDIKLILEWRFWAGYTWLSCICNSGKGFPQKSVTMKLL